MVFQKPVLLRRSAAANSTMRCAARRRAGRGAREPRAGQLPRAGRPRATSRGTPGARALRRRAAAPGAGPRLAVEPEILFLDEPTASLDPASTLAVEELIAQRARPRHQDRPGHPRSRPGAPPRRRGRVPASAAGWSSSAGRALLRRPAQPRPAAFLAGQLVALSDPTPPGGSAMLRRSCARTARWRALALPLGAGAGPRTSSSSSSRPPRPSSPACSAICCRCSRTRPGSRCASSRSAPARRSRTPRTATATCCSSTPSPTRRSSSPTAAGVKRFDVMYNDFVIVGPKSDPAGIKGSKDAAAALRKIAAAKAPFASRGDDSGTHKAELKLWQEAGVDVAGGERHLVPRDRLGHGPDAQHRRRHGRLRADRPRHLAQLPEPRRPRDPGRGRSSACSTSTASSWSIRRSTRTSRPSSASSSSTG